MSSLLNKNLAFIKSHSSEIVYKMFINNSCQPSFLTLSKDGKCITNDDDNKYIHSSRYPEQEAERLVNKWLNHNSLIEESLIVSFAVGEFYHIEELAKRLTENQSLVIIDTDSSYVLKALELYDITKLATFSKNIHFIISNDHNIICFEYLKILLDKSTDELYKLIDTNFFMLPKLEKNKKISSEYKKLLSLFTQKVKVLTKNMDLVTEYQVAEKYLYNALKNIPKILKNHDINTIPKFNNKTAIIAAAGPSLEKAIPIIREFRKNFILFCVDTALKPLLDANIKPDAVMNIDGKNLSLKLFENLNLNDIYLFSSTVAKSEVIEKFNNKYFLFTCKPSLLTDFHNMLKDFKCKPSEVRTMGTVTAAAIDIAVQLKFKNILLLGLDLSFEKGNQTHISNISIKVPKLDDNKLLKVKGNWDKDVLTKPDYANFINSFGKYFADLAKNNSKTNIYNVNDAGALIENVTPIHLKDMGKLIQKEKINKSDMLKEPLNINKNIDKDIIRVKESLDNIYKISKEGEYICNKLLDSPSEKSLLNQLNKIQENFQKEKLALSIILPLIRKNTILSDLNITNQNSILAIYAKKQCFNIILNFDRKKLCEL